MSEYRWNTSDFAVGYDAAAQTIHPHYLEIQQAILDRLPLASEDEGLLVDLGGGSGRLARLFLERFPRAMAVVLDQSEPFLALAERRLEAFGRRAVCAQARLQDDWPAALPARPIAIVSMSAIHHLEPAEKKQLYRRCGQALLPGGVLLNGDEVRPADEAEYLAEVNAWAEHMRRHMADGSIGPLFHGALHTWIERNLTRFGQPRKSGDDCHETIDAQLEYFQAAGFATVDCPWKQGMWALLRGVK